LTFWTLEESHEKNHGRRHRPACRWWLRGGSGDEETAEPLTQAQKDSIVGNLPVPGASGVRGTLGLAEKAKARAKQHDSMR